MSFTRKLARALQGENAGLLGRLLSRSGSTRTGGFYCFKCGRSLNQRDRRANTSHPQPCIRASLAK